MSKPVSHRQVLFLQSESISVLINGRSSASRRWTVVNDEIPMKLSSYLLANKSAVFDLLIDVAEEECHLDALPSLSGRDKKHYIERVRDKYFLNALLSSVLCCPTKKSSFLLVSGISQNSLCKKLLEALSGAEVVLKTIHSPVSLAPLICQRLRLMKGAQLLVLRLSKRSVRLIACLNSFVVLSRGVDLVVSADEDFNTVLVKTVQETLVYLDRKEIAGWVSPKVNLVADVVDHGAFGSLDTLVNSDVGVEVNSVHRVDFIRANGLSDTRGSVEQLLSALLTKGGSGYEQRSHTLLYTRRKMRHACFALAVSLFGGVLSSAAVAKKVNTETNVLLQRYEQSTELAKTPLGLNGLDYEVSVEAVRQALVTARFAEIRSQDSPNTFLSHLSGVIDSHPAVSITTVSWERDDLLDEKSLRLVLGQEDGIDKLPMELVYRATVSGAIKGSAGSALDTFEAFVNTLRRTNADSTVVVVEAPFGMSQNARVTAADLIQAGGRFTVEVNTRGGNQ